MERLIAERLVHNRMRARNRELYKRVSESIDYEPDYPEDDYQEGSDSFEYKGVRVWRDDDGSWVDSNGNHYMSYLSKSDIKTWISQDTSMNEDLSLDDDPEETEQRISSADTSINSQKLPMLFKKVSFKEGSINLDYGGGKFDNVADYLMNEYGATNLVYDKYNRSSEHNRKVLGIVRQNGGADTVTLSNVLNVIAEEEERLAVLRNCKRFLKPGGTCYIFIYEGDSSGIGKETSKGYQLNRKPIEYEGEIKSVFSNFSRKGKLYICS